MTAWYYSDTQRNRLGPVTGEDLAQLHENGQLAPDTLVWREGMADWRPWREVMGEVVRTAPPADNRARFAAPAAEPALAAAGGYNPYEIVERVAPSPYAAPQAAVGGAADVIYGGDVVYAGFWKRYAAYFIDGIIVGIAGAIVGGIAGAVLGGALAMGRSGAGALVGIQVVTQLIGLAIGVAYYAGFHSSSSQATPGKQLIGIKVVRTDGSPISFARGTGRYFATFLSSLILCIGWIMAGFTERKQGLHDMICDTLVVDRWAFTPHPERQRTELGTATIVIIAISVLAVIGMIVFAGAMMAMLSSMAGRS